MKQTLRSFNRYLCHMKKGKEINFKFKAITNIDPLIGWFKIIQHDDKHAILIVNLDETM